MTGRRGGPACPWGTTTGQSTEIMRTNRHRLAISDPTPKDSPSERRRMQSLLNKERRMRNEK